MPIYEIVRSTIMAIHVSQMSIQFALERAFDVYFQTVMALMKYITYFLKRVNSLAPHYEVV